MQTTSATGETAGIPGLPVPQFFVDHKKGEVNELRMLLRAVSLEKDQTKKRDVIKKVIAYMTLGIDVSRLYPEMVKASRTDDLVMKKMIYLYLTNYAEQNQELAILAINTFLMDLNGVNSKIRGLALRSLCSLKFDGVVEYMQQAIDIGIQDPDPYVKKTAIIGCIKLFHMNKSMFKKQTGYLEKLYDLTADVDSLVVINAIEAINEIQADKGGIDITRSLVINLLNRIKDFNEWGQSVILDMCAKYKPETKDEMFDIMNLLEDRFKHASSSVVLGAIKVFLHLTDGEAELSKQVYLRMQAPLITLMTSSETTESYEVSYNVLSHIHLLVLRGANFVFESEYKQFFVKYDEPSYIKNLKLEILAQVASTGNIQEIVNELSEYVTDVNAEIAKRSIKCFGTIIIRLPAMSKTVTAQLRNFLSLQINYVTTETIKVLKDILRKYPTFVDEFVPLIAKIQMESIAEAEGKIAFVWILGEFGDKIEEAPYILESLTKNEMKDLNSPEFSSALMMAIYKLFFKRAPECKQLLGTIFQEIIQNSTDSTLKQQAIFLYRLLRANITLAREVAEQKGNTDFEEFFEDKNDEVRERLFMEFNSLSVVYQKPSERFLKETELKQSLASEKKYFPERKKKIKLREQQAGIAEGDDAGEDDTTVTDSLLDTNTTANSGVQPQNQSQGIDDLLGLGPPASTPAASTNVDDLLGIGTTPPAQQQQQQPADLLGDVFGGPAQPAPMN